jgi:hypothetical protein
MSTLPLFVSARKTTLQSSITAGETSTITLKNLVDIYGNALSMTDFGDIMYLVINPGNDNAEIISATDFTVNSDGTVDIDTGITRGLAAVSPYSTGGTARAHAAGTTVIVSNNPQLYNLIIQYMVDDTTDQTIEGKKTFSEAPISSSDASADSELVRKSQLDAAVFGDVTLAPMVIPATAGETVAVDQLVFLDVSDGEWYLADATTAAEVDNVILGITRGAGTDGNAITNGVTIMGLHEASSAIFTANTAYYASDTPGGFSDSAGTTEVSVGFAQTTTYFYLYPRYNQQITEAIQDALAGTSGTPSGTNKFVTDDDTATSGANKVLRLDKNNRINENVGGIHTLDFPAGETTIAKGQAVRLGNINISATTTISTSTDGAKTFGKSGDEKLSQSVNGDNNTYGQVIIDVYKVGTPTDNITVTIEGDDGGFPDGTPLATGTVAMSGLDTSAGSESTVDLDVPVRFESGSVYYIVVERTGSLDSSNYGIWARSTSDQYGGTTRCLANYNGFGWVNENTQDAYLKLVSFEAENFLYLADASTAEGVKAPIGIAGNAADYNETVTVYFSGKISGLSGLTAGEIYYLTDTAGTIGTSAGTETVILGVALSTTEIMLQISK